MSKKYAWPEGKYSSAARRPGSYTSLQEMVQKAESFRQEQLNAQAYLAKAQPAMLKLLEIRLTKGIPLVVMRPLQFQTSCLKSELDDEMDRSFYGGVHANGDNEFQKAQNANYVDTVKTIVPGTQLVLKSLDPQMQEFVFEDAQGKEYAINYADRNKLLTQTDIFETVQKYLEEKGD